MKTETIVKAFIGFGVKVKDVSTAFDGVYKEEYIKTHGEKAFRKLVKRERYLKRYQRRKPESEMK
jgi:transposase